MIKFLLCFNVDTDRRDGIVIPEGLSSFARRIVVNWFISLSGPETM